MDFHDVLTKYRALSFSERDKGARFERLMQAYLRTEPKYAAQLRTVWLWDEFPSRDELGSVDTGIDLVAETFGGEFWAIQCKCYDADAAISKSMVDTFLSASGRAFHWDDKPVMFALRVWISTTDKWSGNAENALKGQRPGVTRINLYDLNAAPIDWGKLEQGVHGSQAQTAKYELLEHQKEALNKTHDYFQYRARGKLIMACGTGKTFTALRIAEKEAIDKKLVLYCVPSIALLGQTLREWTAHAADPLHAICICSDPKVSQARQKAADSDGFSTIDLAFPATTNPQRVVEQYQKRTGEGLTVVFSTYQSISVVEESQGLGLPAFDIIICDEAHRTTGVTLKNEDAAAFVRVHSNDAVHGQLRLYMTATPRLYAEDAKAKAKEKEALVWSMDDEDTYGTEIHRIGFGEAVDKDLLSDYKVLIFTVNENDVPPAVQEAFAHSNELPADTPAKLIGCMNALSKLIYGDDTVVRTDPQPMRRAVAFCQNISISKEITRALNDISVKYRESLPKERHGQIIGVTSAHVDGTMSAPVRDEKLAWLKSAEPTAGECRILSNVRCLSEGVDVPALDAVLFLAAKNSQVDVVQSVGRVMRKAEGKRYGYIIIPIVVPSTAEPETALDDNERYKVVWSVLNALRAHDERFDATVNKIDLNKHKPENIVIGGMEYGPYGNEGGGDEGEQSVILGWDRFTQLQSAIYARLVKKVGSRQYWEQWAQSVAEIAERQIQRITVLSRQPDLAEFFAEFVRALQININSEITAQDAIEMLSQHIITAPVFNALFEGYEFANINAVSIEMNAMHALLTEHDGIEETEQLEKFYESVHRRAEGIDNAAGKQRVIIELYNTFFKTAFPKMAERLGIVYTPVEVVDFIVRSANDVLRAEFGRDLGSESVNILDPFTGTGTFITRLLQSGLISRANMEHKYKNEIFANEIVLLAYYIAAVNIENAYHDLIGSDSYLPFEGICLTDTFQLAESDAHYDRSFAKNSERLIRQRNTPLTVIFGNPPYSVDGNQRYPHLDSEIEQHYAQRSDAVYKKALYDSYIRAFRWATERLQGGDGIISFVSNGGWLDGDSTAGLRKSLEEEFSKIYIFNLRGNQRTSGELSRREGGKIFDSGSRTPVTITLLVKRGNQQDKAQIFYRDIGDYLDRQKKLDVLADAGSFLSPQMPGMTVLQPNEHGDWITQRNDAFQDFIALAPEKKMDLATQSVFVTSSLGVSTNRDPWVYNFSQANLCDNMRGMVEFYNQQLGTETPDADLTRISWSRSLLNNARKGKKSAQFYPNSVRPALYRPFNRQWLYDGELMIETPGSFRQFFPTSEAENLVIVCTGTSANTAFSTLLVDSFAGIDTIEKSRCFPLYYYTDNNASRQLSLFAAEQEGYTRRDGVSDWILAQAKTSYGPAVTKEDIFYYVYGFLHSPVYRETFADDLRKALPRIPLAERAEDFRAFSRAGRELARLHLRYEGVAPLPDVEVKGSRANCRVQKMRFLAKERKDTILYNGDIHIENIPARAYEYMVNGRSAIEWVMERYQIKTDRDSGIVNDPNLWCDEHDDPVYILNLLLSVIAVSVQTVDIVAALPAVEVTLQ